MLSDQDIFHRYQMKQGEFAKNAAVSLIGHSLFDMWENQPAGTPSLAGKRVANLGLSGTSTRQYLDVIVKANRLQHLGESVFLFLGVNDIVKEPNYSPQQVMDWLTQILAQCYRLAPHSRYFLLEATPVNNITNVDNPTIMAMNQYFRAHCPKNVTFIETWQAFLGNDGKLNKQYCVDGLHFNAQGYAILQRLLEKYL